MTTLPVREPTVALRAVFDIPHKFPDIAQEVRDAAAELTARARSGTPDWPSIYDDAVIIVERMAVHLDAEVESLQRQLLDADPNELKARLAAGGRREAEKRRSEFATTVSAIEREWVERAGRQAEHVIETCTQYAKGMKLVDQRPGPDGLVMQVDPASWSQLTGYVSRCCDEWSSRVARDLDPDLANAFGAAMLALGGGGVPGRPSAERGAPNDGNLSGAPPTKTVEVPSTGAALFQYLRTNMMAVGMLGTVLTVGVAMAGRLGGDTGAGAAGSNSMLMRGGLLIVLLPAALAFGFVAATRQRDRTAQRAREDYDKSLDGFVKSEIEKAAQRHRKSVERWIRNRAIQWTASYEGELRRLDETFRSEDERNQKVLVDAKLAYQKLQDALQRARTARNTASGALLADLRRRREDLAHAP